MHMKIKPLLTLCISILITLSLSQQANAKMKIIYVPLDNRPVCLDYVQDTATKAGYPLTIPPTNLLASYKANGNIDQLWQWLEKEAPSADAAVISTDALTYGGLVASRKHQYSTRFLAEKTMLLQSLKNLNPSLKTYAFSSIMRTPRQSAGDVEPNYYPYFGPSIFRLSQLVDKEDTEKLTRDDIREKAYLLREIPSHFLLDWNGRRDKNLQFNQQLINMVQDNDFHFLAIGKDDCAPLSQTHMESRSLKKYASSISSNKFQIVPGIDQLGLLLVTRAINDLNDYQPKIYVIYAPGIGGSTIPLYSDETVQASISHQITTMGAKETPKKEFSNLILAVNTPYEGICLDSTSNENAPYGSVYNKQFVKELASLTIEYPVALADISYANGADNGFMLELENRNLLSRFASYSGWNTGDNSIGFALAQGIMAAKMTEEDKNRLLKVRYLDDWIYQSNVRYRLALDIEKQNFNLKYDLGKYYNKVLGAANTLFVKYVHHEPILTGTTYTVEFPWNRLFEVDVQVQ